MMFKVPRRFGRSDNKDAIKNVYPGEILWEEFMLPAGTTAYALARELRVPLNRISAILQGTRGITPETALLLGIRFGTSAEFWANLQIAHDLEEARRGFGLDPRLRGKMAVNLAARAIEDLDPLARPVRHNRSTSAAPSVTALKKEPLIAAAAFDWVPEPVGRGTRQMTSTTIRIPSAIFELLQSVARSVAAKGARPSVSGILTELVERARGDLLQKLSDETQLRTSPDGRELQQLHTDTKQEGNTPSKTSKRKNTRANKS